MKRRELLGNMMFASVAAGMAPLAFPSGLLAASCPGPIPPMPRTLVNVMLNGGADLRFLFMPRPGALPEAHENLIYASRRIVYASSRTTPSMTYSEMFALEYDLPAGQDFGIHKSSGWLTSQFEAGNVAIVPNAYCSRNRRHDQSILNANVGEPGFDRLIFERDGWGGRLVEQMGGGVNAVELGGSISVFNKGTVNGNRLAQVIHAQNVRDIALPDVNDSGGNKRNRDSVIRALKGYYNSRGQEVLNEKPNDWPYHIFYDHNAAFREFGGEISQRMAECGALPSSLLPGNAGGDFDLNSNSFEQQCRNLYDVCLAPDLFGLGALSMNYGGWDTHNNEEVRAGANLNDIFGADRGLDRATTAIAGLESNAIDQLTFYFASDFGRQIVANGDLGTDHGRGTYAILMGKDVNGGVYGTMFPAIETVEDNGQIPLQRHGADIYGETATDNVLAEACDWASPGSSSAVFPSRDAGAVEDGVSLSGLMSS